MGTLAPLPTYPSAQARKGFSASHLAHFNSNISHALAQVIALPPAKRDTPPTRAFISSYLSDAARQALEALIWEDAQPAKQDDPLRNRVLLLAEKLATSPPGLDSKTILNICVSFPSRSTRLRSIMTSAISATPDLPAIFTSQVVPSFTSLLSPSRSSGLYGLRKTARCLTSLLRPSPPELVRPFAHDKEFLVALARTYDDGLSAIARSYGGIRMGTPDRPLDQSERLWLDTKVDIVDAFHIIVTTLVRDVSSASGAALAIEADRAFGSVFALLDITPQSAGAGPSEAVPFLNRSLIADYQYAYELTETLSSALRHASREDARMEHLESVLRPLDVPLSEGGAKDPGVLKLLLRSSGVTPGASTSANSAVRLVAADKGKAKVTVPTSVPPPHDPDLDLKVAQVLDIFPDHSPEYVRKLLAHPSFPFSGNAERVIEALLEGTAPSEDALGDGVIDDSPIMLAQVEAPIERRNVFDTVAMDLSRIHIGKKTLDGHSITRDRTEIERMKADVIRLAEAMSADSDEEEGTVKLKTLDVIDLDDDIDEASTSNINILGDGEESGDEEVDPIKPETILELAYIRDPKLFDRDAETRRSRARADLKQRTGWTDEQIEGWRIMLERNPKKERILQKHEFSGNRVEHIPIAEGSGGHPGGGQRGGERGRGRGQGRGRGRGRGGGSVENKEDVARERAWKERHKSNHRKRGHDKKMGKAA